MAELAPRDIVSRTIDTEMKRSGADHVLLDMTRIGRTKIKALFPAIYDRCLSIGLDITKEPIPVAPAAHYMCGGVWTDLWGRTSIPRLYACGEVACTGLHGANRLASNSLLEALVFGERAALEAADLSEPRPIPQLDAAPEWPSAGPDPAVVRARVQREMWQDVGIVRNDVGLRLALSEVRELSASPSRSRDREMGLEAANLLATATAAIECALMRRESRGTHFNEDCPERDDVRWARPTLLAQAGTRRPEAV
jgi:aspartate oxidase